MKKHVLIILCGMSPAVITETVYALCKRQPSETPDEVIVITTTAGAACIKQELLDSRLWNQLRSELELDGKKIRFGASSQYLKIIPSGHDDNADAGDILSSADNARAADFILGILRQFSENPDTSIVFSIAGGRKTMSALGALCMSLLGREHDRLCHILVNPPFDDPRLKPKFYWPPSGDTTYHHPDGRIFKSAAVQLSFCEIPFVCMRNLFKEKLSRLPGSYNDTVTLANNAINGKLDLPDIVFKLHRQECFIGETAVLLSPVEYLLYWLLAQRRRRGEEELNSTRLWEEMNDLLEKVDRARIPWLRNCEDKLEERLAAKTADEYLRKAISSLAEKIRKAYPLHPAPLLPSNSRGKYGVQQDPAKIFFN